MVATVRLSTVCWALVLALGISGIQFGSANSAELTASWVDNSNGAATTRLERRLGNESTFVAIADIPPGGNAYLDASVSPGMTYCYRALAYTAEASSKYSNEACTTVSAVTATVTVSKTGTGAGTVVSTPAGIDCGAACTAAFLAGTAVTLSATAAAGSTFDGWSGSGCTGADPCTIAGNGTTTVTAVFSTTAPPPVTSYPLTVSVSGPGTVQSLPAGIQCGADCSEVYPEGTLVTLTATPNNKGSMFTGWSGGCSGTNATCTMPIQSAASVSAAFKGGKGK